MIPVYIQAHIRNNENRYHQLVVIHSLQSSRDRLFSDWLEDVQHLPNVSILGLKKTGQPSSFIGEAHVHHRLYSNLYLRVRMIENRFYCSDWCCCSCRCCCSRGGWVLRK